MNRYRLVLVLLLSFAPIAARSSGGTPSFHDPVQPAGPAATDPVPESIRTAAEQGRYWRASRLMGDYLRTVTDTTPATLLFAARVEAGWGNWTGVSELLEGRRWLDEVEGGAGWGLLGRSRAARGHPADGARAFQRQLAAMPDGVDGTERATAWLRRGLALAEADSAAAALDAFRRSADVLPWFGDWAAAFAAGVAAEAGDTAGLGPLIQEAGELLAGRRWRLRLTAALEAGDTLAAREVALETARTSGSAWTRAAARAELGALRIEAGDTARGRAALLEAMETPAAAGAARAARLLSELEPTPREWKDIGAIFDRHGNASRAAEGYRAYLDAGTGTALERYEARLALGRARYRAGRYAQAERGLLQLADESVPASIGATALYLAARAQYRQGRSEDGQRTLARLPERFPGEPVVTEGLFLLADLKHDDQELDDARRYYRQAADAYPDLNEAGLSLMRLGGLALLEADFEEAAAVFEEYRSLHPNGRRWAQSTYWAARSYAALARDGEADARLRELRAADPLSYYGMRAAELLGEPFLDIPMTAAPAVDPAVEARVRDRLRGAAVLADLGLRDEVDREVDRVRDDVAGETAAEYALAEALNERGYTLSAINLGWELYRRDRKWNRRLLRIIYPFPYRGMVIPESRERDVDPYLVAGLIRRESAFDPAVTSGAGAIGLMQIMPPTGRTLARSEGPPGFEPALLKQPEVNVHLGTRYLRTMLERFDNRLPLVLSAYNAGPTRAERWKGLPEARDPELFIERIPYSETREYVRKVLLHRALYQALYPVLETD